MFRCAALSLVALRAFNASETTSALNTPRIAAKPSTWLWLKVPAAVALAARSACAMR